MPRKRDASEGSMRLPSKKTSSKRGSGSFETKNAAVRIVFPTVLLELAPSRIDGVGVRAAAGIRRGQRVAPGIHEADYRRLVLWDGFSQYEPAVQAKVLAFCVGTPQGFIAPDKLDFNALSIDWYFNHSCQANLGFDDSGDFVARRVIAAGEELTYDYGLAESNPGFRMDCRCGSETCRRVITGDDWKKPEFRAANLPWMLPRLRREPKVSFLVEPRVRRPRQVRRALSHPYR